MSQIWIEYILLIPWVTSSQISKKELKTISTTVHLQRNIFYKRVYRFPPISICHQYVKTIYRITSLASGCSIQIVFTLVYYWFCLEIYSINKIYL